MSDETTVASQVLPSSGAFDGERFAPAADGGHTMEVTKFSEKPSQSGDSLNHSFTLVTEAVNGAPKTVAYANINFKPEWLQPENIGRIAAGFREYSKLQGDERKKFKDAAPGNKEIIRAGIALKAINHLAAYLGLADMQTGQVEWTKYQEKVATDAVGLTVRANVTQKDSNDRTRRDVTKEAKQLGLSGPEITKYVASNFEPTRAEADFNYPAGWKTA